jgi:YbgC/YbaW family acyl-CoA thioester hydrolase
MSTKALPKEVESKVKVRFPDCDPFNHLNNSKYIDYIINAREDQLIEYYDFDVYKIAKATGSTWVVAQTQIAYLSSAELMEILTIQTRLLSYTEKYLMVEAVMFNEDKTQVKAIMWTKLAHYNLVTRRSQEHTPELMDFFNEVNSPIDRNPSFGERINFIKQQNKSQ